MLPFCSAFCYPFVTAVTLTTTTIIYFSNKVTINNSNSINCLLLSTLI